VNTANNVNDSIMAQIRVVNPNESTAGIDR